MKVFSRLNALGMMDMLEYGKVLSAWYQRHKRDLPWREDADGYRIWLSEIILQQTRVDQGLPYYQRFIEHYPSVEQLANAPQDEIMKLWQGLGYYSRARNLHKAAKYVHHELNNQFPTTYADLIKLPGVGPYTAAAIASIAFGESVAVVDGNVIRVISRLFGISEAVDQPATQNKIKSLAQSMLASHDPSTHNQALMEFGALQCIPRNPECHTCPLQHTCDAFINRTMDQIPRKGKKVKRRKRYLHFVIAQDKDDNIAIERRNEGDIWAGLYQFPMLETAKDTRLENTDLSALLGVQATLLRINPHPKHVLSHQDLHAYFYHLQIPQHTQSKYTLIRSGELHTFALPRLIDRYLENYDLVSGQKQH